MKRWPPLASSAGEEGLSRPLERLASAGDADTMQLQPQSRCPFKGMHERYEVRESGFQPDRHVGEHELIRFAEFFAMGRQRNPHAAKSARAAVRTQLSND